MELFNKEQLMHMFRTNDNNPSSDFIKESKPIKIQNEDCVSHMFINKKRGFNSEAFDVSKEFPKLPQSLELVNQTVSIQTEPVVDHYTYKNVLEFN